MDLSRQREPRPETEPAIPRGRFAEGMFFPQPNELRRLGVRQRFEQYRVHDREYRRRRANGEREREQHGERQSTSVAARRTRSGHRGGAIAWWQRIARRAARTTM